MIEIILYVYLGVMSISLLATALFLQEESIKGVDNIWDWLLYSVFWIIQPIKAIIKLVSNL